MCCFVRNSIFLVEFSLWKFQVNLWISLWAEANTCWLFESIKSWKVSSRELKFPENTAQTASLFKMVARQAMKENLQCTYKYSMVIYVYRRISVMYGWQILRASLPYMGIVTICWIIKSDNLQNFHTPAMTSPTTMSLVEDIVGWNTLISRSSAESLSLFSTSY